MREIERDIVGAFIVSEDNKILLGHNVKGGVFDDSWVIPGGGIDEGETKKQAVIREVAEEIGIDVSKEDISFFETIFSAKAEKTLRESGERVLVDMTFYDAIIRMGRPASGIHMKYEDDFADAQFFLKDELAGLKIADPTKRRLIELGFLKAE